MENEFLVNLGEIKLPSYIIIVINSFLEFESSEKVRSLRRRNSKVNITHMTVMGTLILFLGGGRETE